MKTQKTVVGCIATFIAMPMWFFLTWKILKAVNADMVTWSVFWAYVPISFLVRLLTEIIAANESTK